MYGTSSTLLFSFSLISFVTALNDFQSPCPRFFVYEPRNEVNTWYGNITLISESDTTGVWVRILLDRPSLQLSNWYGDVHTKDNKEYLIANIKDRLKANMPKTIQFFIKYDPSESPPKLVSFYFNTKLVCPEGGVRETTTMSLEVKTISQVEPRLKLPEVEETISSRSADPDEDFFMGDFHHLLNSPPKNNDGDTGIYDICGTVVNRPKPLITYGDATGEGEFPWHVALYHVRGTDLTYICGASLLTTDFIITVAHCVTRTRSTTPLNTDRVTVYLGKHYLKSFTNEGIQDRQISEIIIHPKYSAHNYANDIALIKVSVPVEFTDYVRPICLWQESTDLSMIVQKHGKVAGWGFDETGKVSEELRQAEMPVVSQETCIFSYPDFYSRFTSPNTFCAGFRNGTSVCNGDSGGGLVFPKSNSSPENPVLQLRGLVSISAAVRDKTKCDTSHFVVFTDTAKYLDWIKNEIK